MSPPPLLHIHKESCSVISFLPFSTKYVYIDLDELIMIYFLNELKKMNGAKKKKRNEKKRGDGYLSSQQAVTVI